MGKLPKKVQERLSQNIPRFQSVLENAKKRDVNESDTVTIINDMLGEVFGFDKYAEVTSEFAIKSTYCDLAIKIDDTIKWLIEVKAIGITLKENHLTQAINYGANEGIPWVILTNGMLWEIYRIKFERPISHEWICAIDFSELNHRKHDDLERAFLFCKEALSQDAIEEYHAYTQVVNRFTIAALINSEPVLKVLRRELKALSPSTNVTTEEVAQHLPDVLKRDVIEGEDAKNAEQRVKKMIKKQLKKKAKKDENSQEQPSNEAATSNGDNLPPVVMESNSSAETQS